jgi:hypothetical protein
MANGEEIVRTLRQVAWPIVTAILLAVAQAESAEAAAKGYGGCGEYRYYHNGRCMDARGDDAGPATHWHPNDPSNSIH